MQQQPVAQRLTMMQSNAKVQATHAQINTFTDLPFEHGAGSIYKEHDADVASKQLAHMHY